MIELSCQCRLCRNYISIEVEFEDYLNYNYKGVLAQDAFPYLTKEERELIISGVCGECWHGVFGEDEE